MNRRAFLQTLATRTAAATALGIAVGCTSQELGAPMASPEAVAQDTSLPEIDWQMATSWPVSLDTIFGTAQIFADTVALLTGGKFKITPRAAGELAPGLEVLNVVQEGAVPIGHTASYYYLGKSPVTAFGTTLPFGLNARAQNAWLYEGGGLPLLQDYFKAKFGVIQFPAGNTGVQMGGWFNREIKSVVDLQGLKMRIAGLGGQVMAKLGVNVQVLPAGEIFGALQTGAIDAAEWVGPYDDEKLGFQKVTKYYYYPSWWEPGPSLEVEINLQEWEKLPEVYQEAVRTAAIASNMIMLARYDNLNPPALQRLLTESEVQLLPFPDDVLKAGEAAAFELYDELAAQDADFKAILEQWVAYRDALDSWFGVAELSYLQSAAARQGSA